MATLGIFYGMLTNNTQKFKMRKDKKDRRNAENKTVKKQEKDLLDLFDVVSKFQIANQKYLLPNINSVNGAARNYRIVQTNHTSSFSE